jgi:hypothetical protein
LTIKQLTRQIIFVCYLLSVKKSGVRIFWEGVFVFLREIREDEVGGEGRDWVNSVFRERI